ncbi:MAG TPA: hypothetical protein VK577_05325, partial [Bradyrhizobium sp.]|nr:hypothetical protein [Bradyrhizobium sp.]
RCSRDATERLSSALRIAQATAIGGRDSLDAVREFRQENQLPGIAAAADCAARVCRRLAVSCAGAARSMRIDLSRGALSSTPDESFQLEECERGLVSNPRC